MLSGVLVMAEQQTHTSYVSRKLAVIEQIQTCLQTLQAGAELDTPLFNLYGLAGLGKTFVLQQLYDMCKKDYIQCDVVWLDFDLKDVRPIDPAAAQSYPLSLERTPWQAVAAQLQVHPDLSDSFQGEIVLDNGVKQTLAQFVDILFAQAVQPDSGRPLLLLLDSLDNLPYWKWLQAQLIKPLFEQQRTLIVCTSRVKLNWHPWELRESCLHWELETFSKADTSAFLRIHQVESLTDTVYWLSRGYPLLLRHFVEQMYLPAASESACADMRKKLDTLTSETRWVLEQVGLLRRMHVAAMQHLLGKEWATPEAHRRLHQAMAELKQKDILLTSPDTFERFAPAVREVIREFDSSATFDCYDRIASYYYELATYHPKHDADALIEWLYFSTGRLHAEQNALRETWFAQLDRLFERIVQVDTVEHEVYQAVLTENEIKDHGERANIGAKVVAWLYTDGELLQRLAALDLLDPLRQRLAPHLQHSAHAVPIRHDLRRVTSDVIQELGRRATAFGTPGMVAFEPVLRSLLPFDPVLRSLLPSDIITPYIFDYDQLRTTILETWQQLRERPTRSVAEFIIQLTGSGMLRYDEKRRIYSFHDLIDQLLKIAQRDRFAAE